MVRSPLPAVIRTKSGFFVSVLAQVMSCWIPGQLKNSRPGYRCRTWTVSVVGDWTASLEQLLAAKPGVVSHD